MAKHILFIMTDQQRADHVGWHPASRQALPHIDRLAEGAVFDTCITVNPICTPCRTALLTGRYSRQIGTLAMSGDLRRDIPTYAQALQRAGWHTAAIGKFHWLQTWKWGAAKDCGVRAADIVDDLHGFGFDEVWEAAGKQLAQHNICDWQEETFVAKDLRDDYIQHVIDRGRNFGTAEQTEFTGEPWPYDEADYVDIATGERVRASLRNRPTDKSWFGFASFCGPHAPYDPPQRFLDMVPEEQDEPFITGGPDDADMSDATIAQMKKLRRAYKAMLLCIDEQVGHIFAELERQGMWDDTLIIFTTDHGEMLGDHGFFQKARPQWQSAKVPMAIRHPDHLDGRRIDAPVEITDITATILAAAGLDPHQALTKDWPAFNNIIPCRSLLPQIAGDDGPARDFAFSECTGQWSMIRTATTAYVRYHQHDDPDAMPERFYDLTKDPDECCNLADDPRWQDRITWHRNRLLYMLERHPASQSRWAPLTAPDGSDDYR